AFGSGLAAVAFGALGAFANVFAPWIGAMTTIAASIAAYGLIDRRKYLISSYAAMQASLERIKALDETSPASLADLVSATEDLLDSEHRAWQPQMLALQREPPQPRSRAGKRRKKSLFFKLLSVFPFQAPGFVLLFFCPSWLLNSERGTRPASFTQNRPRLLFVMSFRPSATHVTGALRGTCRKRESGWVAESLKQRNCGPHWLRLGHESHRAPKWRRKPLKSRDSRPEMAAGRETGGGRACGPLRALLAPRSRCREMAPQAVGIPRFAPKIGAPAEKTG